MADVIGPNSYLPGKHLKVPDGMMCDEHQDRPAVYRIVGESDSFGSELLDMCQECYDKMCGEADQFLQEYCEFCKQKKDDLRHYRDPEEGSCGPVYMVCFDCRVKHNKAFVGE